MKVQASVKRTLRISFSMLVVFGLTYWFSRSWMRTAGEFGETPHWLEKVAGPVHFLSALTFLIVLGTIWSQHIRLAIRVHKHRVSGWIFLGLMGGMMASATGLLYMGGDLPLKVLGYAHPIIGTCMIPLLIFHWTRKAKD